MAAVELRMDPVPAHVRTARQVATVLARRAGVAPDALDEVRLAVGEACGLAVTLQQRATGDGGPVVLRFEDADGLAVEIRGGVPLATAHGAAAVRVLAAAADDPRTGDVLPPAAVLAVLAEVAPSCSIATGPGGPRITLAWPAA